MAATVKITPRIAAQVARRLRLAASIRSSSMSRLVNDALDETLPSLDEIRMQLAAPATAESVMVADIAAGNPGPVTVTAARGGPVAAQALEGGTGDGSGR
jgi:hypothetical protein